MTLDPYRFRPQPTMTAAEAAAKAGLDLDTARKFNRALGLPEIEGSTVDFDERDVEVLRVVKTLAETGIPKRDLITVARIYGQALARIADAETRVFKEHLLDALVSQGLAGDELEQRLERLIPTQLDLLGRALDYVHRRHLAAALQQLGVADTEGSREKLAVGFIDLARFTQISEDLSGENLGELVDRFEDLVIETCAPRRVRAVKMIGDAAMLVSADADAALDAAATIVTSSGADDVLPRARSGLDLGEVVPFAGDYFGHVVNVAARATAFARAGTIVVTADFAASLASDSVDLTRLRPPRLKGIGHVRLFKVSRAGELAKARRRT